MERTRTGQRTLKLLALDVSGKRTGWAVLLIGDGPPVLQEYGVIQIVAGWPVGRRLFYFHKKLERVISAHVPDRVIIEQGFIRFIKTAMTLFKFLGIAHYWAQAVTEQEPLFMTATEVRGALKTKDKEETLALMNKRFGINLKEHELDESDAIALGWVGYSKLLSERRKKAKKKSKKPKSRRKNEQRKKTEKK